MSRSTTKNRSYPQKAPGFKPIGEFLMSTKKLTDFADSQEFTAKSSKTAEKKTKLAKKTSIKASTRNRPRSKATLRQFVFAIEGAHGVGKTTVYEKMKLSFEENNLFQFFPELSGGPPPFPFGSKDLNVAFRSEVYYMQQMGKRNIKVQEHLERNPESIIVLDRSPISTLVYSSALNLDRKDFDLLLHMYDHSHIWMPEIIIYLDAKPETIMKRIIQRGSLDPVRLTWNENDMIYLKRILKNYEYYLANCEAKQQASVYRINTDDKTIDEVYADIIGFIENRTGMNIYKAIKIPNDQLKLDAFY